MHRWRVLLLSVSGLAVGTLILFVLLPQFRPRIGGEALTTGATTAKPQYTVQDRLDQYAEQVRARLRPAFRRRGLEYPPTQIALLAFKQERRLELWAKHDGPDVRWTRIKTYPFTAFSGVLGPKLREGDLQIPEGVYRVSALNPNSRYHLSLKINYPNRFDLQYARQEGRRFPGTNIFLHGRDRSVGCVALGDRAIEELFVLAAGVGNDSVRVIIAPYDFRRLVPGRPPVAVPGSLSPRWLPQLYTQIRLALSPFRPGGQKTLTGCDELHTRHCGRKQE